MKNIYDNMYDKERKLDLKNTPRIKIMLEVLDKLNLKNKNILDIGCYDGTFISLIKNRDNVFFGAEASEYGFVKSKEKGIGVEKFFFDDKATFPFKDNFFDLIIAGEIIEHIYDTDFFLEEIKRMLKPGGKLLISTPNVASFGRRVMLLLGINPIIEISPNEKNSSGHIRYFVFKTLLALLKKHNFEIIERRSDVINFSSEGGLSSRLLADIFPGIGQSLICLCRKGEK